MDRGYVWFALNNSTTDYIQHKFATGSYVDNKFYDMMDSYLAQLDKL